MRHQRLLLALGLALGAAVVAAGQVRVSPTLSEELRTHVREGRWDIVTSVRGLPLGVRETLQRLFGSATLDIAEPGAGFQQGVADDSSSLPTRRLIAAACSTTYYCLVYYERGGSPRTHHVLLFHWRPTGTDLLWGSLAPGGLASSDAVRKAILAGQIKEPAKIW